jgi:hypothetical protein
MTQGPAITANGSLAPILTVPMVTVLVDVSVNDYPFSRDRSGAVDQSQAISLSQ